MADRESTDEENELTDTRGLAAGYARRRGLEDVAARIEGGELDDAPEMRIATLMRQKGEHDPEYLRAWDELVAADGAGDGCNG
ncbi:MAG TPA: hypothetical protein VF782_12440 [Allosphingosinicella sp.]|jgi:hypothetical protein